MFKFWRKKKQSEPVKAKSVFTTDPPAMKEKPAVQVFEWEQPDVPGAQDSSIDGTVPAFKGGYGYGMPEAQVSWYASQGFIGYTMMTYIAKHWLVDKAITMPARDAIRQGYQVDCDHDDVIRQITERSKDRDVNKVMREFIQTGRRMGGAAALFVVESTDPDYYEKPFNMDGVAEGSYKGIKIIDPSWTMPDLTAANVQDPASLDFYNPSFYLIGTRRYHRSHFCFYIPYPVANMAKHTYRYFGVSVPERIYERVYAAERTANEAPELALTKRLLTMGVPGLGDADKATVASNMAYFIEMRNNYGVQVSDEGTAFQQFDTSLADLDSVIMTQYQLVAAGAEIPATKLLETTPKGFNATGESEAENYRVALESIQTNDLEPLLNRHYDMTCKSMGLGDHDIKIVWNPLDSPTAAEYAAINLSKAQAAQAYVGIGAIDGEDVRKQLQQDKESDFYGLEDSEIDLSAYLDDDETYQEA